MKSPDQELEERKQGARRCADILGEDVYLVLEPPTKYEYRDRIPYVTTASQASPEEKSAGILIQHRPRGRVPGAVRRRTFSTAIGGAVQWVDRGESPDEPTFQGKIPESLLDAAVQSFLAKLDPCEVYGLVCHNLPGFSLQEVVFYKLRGADAPV